MTNGKEARVLIVGQTPPPLSGQAVMIQTLLSGRYDHAVLFHTRMAFSREIDDVGKWRLGKLLHLARVVLGVIYRRIRDKCDVLYFPPAGPNRVPFWRDVCILGATRWMFRKVIFHFHAAGLSNLYPRLGKIERALFRWVYSDPDIVVRLPLSPEDGRFFGARKEFIVPYGISSVAGSEHVERDAGSMSRILFVGMMCESKGVIIAIEALSILLQKGLGCRFEFMGQWESVAFEDKVRSLVRGLSLHDHVTFLGVQAGEEKKETFLRNGILCFPTYYESESFGLVLLEAMQFSMPVITTFWRGIPFVVDDGQTGYLVPVRDSLAVARKLELLIRSPELAVQMGLNGRRRFLENFTVDRFYSRMDEVFRSLKE